MTVTACRRIIAHTRTHIDWLYWHWVVADERKYCLLNFIYNWWSRWLWRSPNGINDVYDNAFIEHSGGWILGLRYNIVFIIAAGAAGTLLICAFIFDSNRPPERRVISIRSSVRPVWQWANRLQPYLSDATICSMPKWNWNGLNWGFEKSISIGTHSARKRAKQTYIVRNAGIKIIYASRRHQ